jgi:hypothetical protein
MYAGLTPPRTGHFDHDFQLMKALQLPTLLPVVDNLVAHCQAMMEQMQPLLGGARRWNFPNQHDHLVDVMHAQFAKWKKEVAFRSLSWKKDRNSVLHGLMPIQPVVDSWTSVADRGSDFVMVEDEVKRLKEDARVRTPMQDDGSFVQSWRGMEHASIDDCTKALLGTICSMRADLVRWFERPDESQRALFVQSVRRCREANRLYASFADIMRDYNNLAFDYTELVSKMGRAFDSAYQCQRFQRTRDGDKQGQIERFQAVIALRPDVEELENLCINRRERMAWYVYGIAVQLWLRMKDAGFPDTMEEATFDAIHDIQQEFREKGVAADMDRSVLANLESKVDAMRGELRAIQRFDELDYGEKSHRTEVYDRYFGKGRDMPL